jgi:hypothetical protein
MPTRRFSSEDDPGILRAELAREAARLLVRGKVQNFSTARKRAARSLSTQRLTAAHQPSNQEIQQEIDLLLKPLQLDSTGHLSLAEQATTSSKICPEDFTSPPADNSIQPAGVAPESRVQPEPSTTDFYIRLANLLYRLETVRLDSLEHPEGDALYHSLQVFEIGRSIEPYDEEFLVACLLHDVGLTINPRQPILSTFDVLGDWLSERTRWFIEQRPVASSGLRQIRFPQSLRKHPDFDLLIELARADREGRVAGAQVPDVEEVIAYLMALDEMCQGE